MPQNTCAVFWDIYCEEFEAEYWLNILRRTTFRTARHTPLSTTSQRQPTSEHKYIRIRVPLIFVLLFVELVFRTHRDGMKTKHKHKIHRNTRKRISTRATKKQAHIADKAGDMHVNKLEDVEMPNTKNFELENSPFHWQKHLHKPKTPRPIPGSPTGIDRNREGRGGKGNSHHHSLAKKQGWEPCVSRWPTTVWIRPLWKRAKPLLQKKTTQRIIKMLARTYLPTLSLSLSLSLYFLSLSLSLSHSLSLKI